MPGVASTVMPAACPIPVTAKVAAAKRPLILVSQRIGPQLQLVHLRPVLFAAFVMEVGARARSGPERAALPAGLRVVDAPVDVLGEEAERIRHAEVDDLAVDYRHQRLAAVGLRDRHVTS